MSHTQARTAQSDLEHIEIAAEDFGRILIELQQAQQTAVSDNAKIALVALIEIAKSGLATANRCRDEIMQLQIASNAIH